MKDTEQLQFLTETLLDEMPQFRQEAKRVPRDAEEQRYFLRCLMNVREPGTLSERFLNAQDELLSREREEKGVIHVAELLPAPGDKRLVLWQGDITRLDADAIVNAANSALLGCFRPGHNCIDNVIHSTAGLQLREECAAIDYLVLVNPSHALPDGWEDEVELVCMTNRHGESVEVERITYEAYCALKDDLARDGVRLDINSAYRSAASQQERVRSFTERYGAAYVKQYVAVPGYSEHHTGLAVDLYLQSQSVWGTIRTKLADHGFILRYPEGKEAITGYGYEPWHVRYVGAETAREIAAQQLTLEEYLDAA